MSTQYNIDEINEFILKAQNKIADLTTLIVNRGGEVTTNMLLALELIDFVESINSEYYTEQVDTVVKWCQEYSYRANLNELAYLQLVGFSTTIIDTGIVTITVSDISDFEDGVNSLLRRFPHNSLALIQGGTPTERYHVDKKMYDILYALAHPFTASTVNLVIDPSTAPYPSGYYELGTTIASATLVGSIIYNSDTKATYYEYTRNGVVIGSRNATPAKNEQPNSINQTQISTDTTYSFSAQFSDGVKSSSKSLLFRQPMYTGLVKRSMYNDVPTLVQGIKDVRVVGELNPVFTIPTGNTSDSDYVVPYIFYPESWGDFTSAINNNFNFINNWHSFGLSMPLADGTTMNGILAIYDKQIEGTTTFKINF